MGPSFHNEFSLFYTIILGWGLKTAEETASGGRLGLMTAQTAVITLGLQANCILPQVGHNQLRFILRLRHVTGYSCYDVVIMCLVILIVIFTDLAPSKGRQLG